MAFTESSQPPQANSLVSFLDTASKTINGLMDKSSKGNKRKVNHTKYLQKRLQRNPSKPKAARQTKSKSAPLTQPPAARATEAPAAVVPPISHNNTWPLLPGYAPDPKPATSQQPEIDFLLQQLTSTAADLPQRSPVRRPCSESALYPMGSFAHPQPPPAISLESQVLIGEQPYGSPYTPSNSSVDEIFDDSAYSSPSSSVYSSPATCTTSTISLAQDWSPPTTAVPTCIPSTTTAQCWGLAGMSAPGPSPYMVSCSEWVSVSSASALSVAYSVPQDQHLPTVPQLWDQIAYSEHLPY